MEAIVQKTRVQAQVSEAITTNRLLVVFQVPVDGTVRLGDRLRFDGLTLNAEVPVENLSTGQVFAVFIRDDNVHDLNIPVKHGGLRTPSPERLAGA